METHNSGIGLSKTLILKGLQCPRALWLAKHPPDFSFPPQPDREARYAAGHEVGRLAQQLFPGGVEVPFAGLSVAEQVEQTQALIAAGGEVIYEAAFAFDGIFVKVDILVRDAAGWQIHEVKMGTSVKEVNLNDVAIQSYVLQGCGLSVSAAFLVHVNPGYVRRGELDVAELFIAEDVLAAALERQVELSEQIAALRRTLQESSEPAIDIGPHCHDPYDCDFIPWCWRHIPKPSVFDLRGNGINKFDFYRRGLIRFEDLPLDELNTAQRQQVEATLHRQIRINPTRLKAFLENLWYPLCHLDFESFSSPIPWFDGLRPYQQVPFQFSLHRQEAPGVEPLHVAWLARPRVDPRRELTEQLLASIPAEACILTYNQAFEKGVLRDLAGQFPDLAPELMTRMEQVRDLMLPFRRRDFYHWRMAGSYSIKQVLPALVPELSYAELEIADGQAAQQAYQAMCGMTDEEALSRLRTSLLNYCELDTLAMVRILEVLRQQAERSDHAGEI